MYTLRLADGTEITGLKWDADRFWTDEDYRPRLTRENLKQVEVICDEKIIRDSTQEGFTGNYFIPGSYENYESYDYRRSGGDERGAYRFYIAAASEQ